MQVALMASKGAGSRQKLIIAAPRSMALIAAPSRLVVDSTVLLAPWSALARDTGQKPQAGPPIGNPRILPRKQTTGSASRVSPRVRRAAYATERNLSTAMQYSKAVSANDCC